MPHHILIAGVGPMPDPNAQRLYAPGLRLWAMTQVLLKAGHNVLVAEAQFGETALAAAETQTPFIGAPSSNAASAPASTAPVSSAETPAAAPPAPASPAAPADKSSRIPIERVDTRWRRARIPLDPDAAAAALRSLAAEFHAEAIVTTSDVMALAAVRSGLPQPIHADYFGDPMAERQMQGAIHNSDAALYDAWAYMLPVLLRADHFSTCSGAQRFALLGMLAAAGRLNRHTAGHNLVDSMPQGLSYERQMDPSGTFKLRGAVVPEDAFVVLFTGGYNTWLDERTLAAALEEAITCNHHIHYVTTGGGLPGHNTLTFDRFRAYADRSRFRDHFHFLGWIPTYQIADVCDQADIAISLDRWSHEAELGLRNRVYLWMARGLAVVTTCLSEELKMFASRRVVLEIPCGNAHAAAQGILRMAEHADERNAMRERARQFIFDEWTSDRLMKPLVQWADSPGMAPDRLAVLGEAARRGAAVSGGAPAAGVPEAAEGSAAGDDISSSAGGASSVPLPQNPLTAAQSAFGGAAKALEQERAAHARTREKITQYEKTFVYKLSKCFQKK